MICLSNKAGLQPGLVSFVASSVCGMTQRGMDPRSRKQIGDDAEQAVAEYLLRNGAEIVARNLRIGALEIDIVARTGALILVVEVRCRSKRAWTSAFSSIDGMKRLRLRRAGERLWNRRYRRDPTVERLRFDVASVHYHEGTAQIEYVSGAF